MKRTIPRWAVVVTLLWISLGALGCGGSNRRDGPVTYPVSGAVMLGGQELEGATVNFQGADGSRSAVGVTDGRGRYELTTFTAGDGAVSGEYRVTITKYEIPPEAFTADDDDDGPVPGGGQETLPKNVLPERYANAQTSGLTATVVEGSNTFDFQIER